MVTTFAAQAGIVLELAEHRHDAERLAVLQDRDRIARDLHDLVIQRLYATGMSLQGAVPLIARPEVADRVSSAVDALDETIREIRSAIFSLQSHGDLKPYRPAGEDPGSRGGDDRAARVRPLAAAGRAAGRRRCRARSASSCCVALREALSNAARHAGASSVDVTVDCGGDLVLRVRRQRQGARRRSTRRSGLANLAERAAGWAASCGSGPPRAGAPTWNGGCRSPRRRAAPHWAGGGPAVSGAAGGRCRRARRRPGRRRRRPAPGAPCPAWRRARRRSS